MLASTMNSTDVNILTVTGRGQVTVNPDMAVLHLGVQTTGESLSNIQAENARISQQVLETLDQLNVTDITTFQYTIDKLYDYVDGKQVDKGYSVRNILAIGTSDLEQVGTIIDDAVNSGANVVELIEFHISDSNQYYLHALVLALDDAYKKAEVLVQSLGLTTSPIPIRIQESSGTPLPPYQYARESLAATPILSGNKQIEATITVKFLY